MSGGKRFFMRFGAVLIAALAWGNGIMLAVFKIQLRAPTRRVDLLPTLQGMFGRSLGFEIDGALWMAIGTGFVIYVFRRTSAANDLPSHDP